MTQYAVRIERGLITRFGDNRPIESYELAEQIVRSIKLLYGEEGTIEKIVLDLPMPDAERSPRSADG